MKSKSHGMHAAMNSYPMDASELKELQSELDKK